MDVNFILFRYDTSDLQIVSGSVKACELQYPISDNLISTQIKSLSDDFEKAAILNLVFFGLLCCGTCLAWKENQPSIEGLISYS